MENAERVTRPMWILHTVMHNAFGDYETSNEIDPISGEFRIKSKPTTLAPGALGEVPLVCIDELLAAGAIRELTEREILAHRVTTGALLVKECRGHSSRRLFQPPRCIGTR